MAQACCIFRMHPFFACKAPRASLEVPFLSHLRDYLYVSYYFFAMLSSFRSAIVAMRLLITDFCEARSLVVICHFRHCTFLRMYVRYTRVNRVEDEMNFLAAVCYTCQCVFLGPSRR